MKTKQNHEIKGFHHVGFVVSNLDSSIEFYKYLGFSRNCWIEKPEECEEGLGVPGAEIELVSLNRYRNISGVKTAPCLCRRKRNNSSYKVGGGQIPLETDNIEKLVNVLEERFVVCFKNYKLSYSILGFTLYLDGSELN